MIWKEKRIMMEKVIKESIVPFLRERGFKGSYPHFKRPQDKKINHLNFQFSQWGPLVYCNVANSPIKGITFADGQYIPPEKVRHYHCLQRSIQTSFDFEGENFERIKEDILNYVLEVVEKWYEEN